MIVDLHGILGGCKATILSKVLLATIISVSFLNVPTCPGCKIYVCRFCMILVHTDAQSHRLISVCACVTYSNLLLLRFVVQHI